LLSQDQIKPIKIRAIPDITQVLAILFIDFNIEHKLNEN